MPHPLMMFAAGFGTRMGTLTANQPKPLIEVAGKPLIDHALALCNRDYVDQIVINLHYRGAQIRQHLSEQDVLFSEEQPDVLETGGGLRQALPLLGNRPVFTLNTDAVWTGKNPLYTLSDHWDPDKMDALLLLIPQQNAQGHTGLGDFALSETGQLTREPGHVYTGTQIIKTDMLADFSQSSFSLNLCWDRMQNTGRLYGVLHDGGWCDVGQPESINLAENMLTNDPISHVG
ncbi:MAG: nucleotidyltransferase family protein [Pseudoruegeria sp.]